MFKRKPHLFNIDNGVVHYNVSRVVKKTDGDSVDHVLVRDVSTNFNEFPRNLESENFFYSCTAGIRSFYERSK